jgi:flagella basal body P-ring formation protein FlgA
MKSSTAPSQSSRPSLPWRAAWCALLALTFLCAAPRAHAQAQATSGAVDAALIGQVRDLALIASQQSRVAGQSMPVRFDVTVGALDSHLKLGPCQRIEPYLPAGVRLWGKARIGLRCTQGERLWNVYLPITVHVYGQALVAAQPLALGTTLQAGDLAYAEVDLAEENSPSVASESMAIGRALTRSLTAGQGVRQADLKSRQWFAAGDTVKVLATGKGFSVAGMGTALSPGFEGQSARVRTDGGQVVTGMPVALRQLEVSL